MIDKFVYLILFTQVNDLKSDVINYGNGYEYKLISKFCPSSNPSQNNNHNKWGTGVDTPKILSDIFKSLIGAILLDGGYNKYLFFF